MHAPTYLQWRTLDKKSDKQGQQKIIGIFRRRQSEYIGPVQWVVDTGDIGVDVSFDKTKFQDVRVDK